MNTEAFSPIYLSNKPRSSLQGGGRAHRRGGGRGGRGGATQNAKKHREGRWNEKQEATGSQKPTVEANTVRSNDSNEPIGWSRKQEVEAELHLQLFLNKTPEKRENRL